MSYLNDLSGKPAGDPPSYYYGRGMWTEQFGKAYLFDTQHEAADFIAERRKGTSWGNKTLLIYATTEKERFKARLKDD